jgi:cellulose synthase/poly-beta-1,6-N-acetylglucosamine synthase-like glycosyltransferase
VFCLLYAWGIYNVPILAVGVRHLHRSKRRDSEAKAGSVNLPTFSIVVPVKDEEKVVGRLVESLLKVDYPREKLEIVLVEDGSVDGTRGICVDYVERFPAEVSLLRQPVSSGKPSALNYALKHVRGEIVAVFDADSVPSSDIFKKAAEYFECSSAAAVQGQMRSINGQESMLAKFVSYEESVRYGTYLNGKDVLSLFVPLTGSCYFVRKSVLDAVGGWDGDSLSEDMELSAKLIGDGHRIRYASDLVSWQENPSNLGQLFRQRVRWFRGCMEVSLKYGRLLRRINRQCIDAEITLFGPFVFVLLTLGYLFGVFGLMDWVQLDPFLTLFAEGTVLFATVTLLLIGIGLVYVSRPRRLRSLLWLPFIYGYWSVQSFIALFALFEIVLRRPRKWVKTVKTGTVTDGVF